jgi:hypothetical protein
MSVGLGISQIIGLLQLFNCHYFHAVPSLNYASFIEWLNPKIYNK